MKRSVVVMLLIASSQYLAACSHLVSNAASSFGDNLSSAFLNQDDPKHAMSARYLYEHFFLAHLRFSDVDSDEFFELIRSTTPPGEAANEIATVRPYDDPGVERFYYRFRKIHSTIVHKTHMVVELNGERFVRYQELFIEPEWDGPARAMAGPHMKHRRLYGLRSIMCASVSISCATMRQNQKKGRNGTPRLVGAEGGADFKGHDQLVGTRRVSSSNQLAATGESDHNEGCLCSNTPVSTATESSRHSSARVTPPRVPRVRARTSNGVCLCSQRTRDSPVLPPRRR